MPRAQHQRTGRERFMAEMRGHPSGRKSDQRDRGRRLVWIWASYPVPGIRVDCMEVICNRNELGWKASGRAVAGRSQGLGQTQGQDRE